jgi:hypothetical protein
MVTSLRVHLRRRWHPAPGWPPAPAGFSPPPGWSPHPTWPVPPAQWTGWRAPRTRLISAAALAILTAIFVLGVRKDAVEQHATATLTTRGVTTLATVVSSSYDANGGDPGGWTTDRISFTTATGQTETGAVGHHNDDTPERASGHMPVIYDPAYPATVMSVADHQDRVSAGAFGFGLAFVTLTALAGAAFLLSALKFTRTKPLPVPARARPRP